MNVPPFEEQQCVLVVDDDDQLRAILRRVLTSEGFDVAEAADAAVALEVLRAGRRLDAIVTDLLMPGMDGVEFLRSVRQLDLDVPLVVLTGHPSLESAVATVRHGGFRYLQKPIAMANLLETVREASAMHRLAILKRRALEMYETDGWLLGDRAALDAYFARAMAELWIAFQPIVDLKERRVLGYEALVRSAEPKLANPGLLFDAAERLGRVHDLGRRIRTLVAAAVARAPADAILFVNLHAADLNDEQLYAEEALLSRHARRIVFEITERSSLDRVGDVRTRIASLRSLGFRIAVDDLGAGYAGLSSFSQLEPDIAKLDMSLVRGIDTSPRKSSIVRSMIAVCTNDLGTGIVCEGVETAAERDTLRDLGAHWLQGYLFGRPNREFREPENYPERAST